MGIKKSYSNYDEINLDLEILRTEKEIAYRKIVKSLKNTKLEVKDAVSPLNLIKGGFQTFKTNKSSGIKAILISAVIKFIMNKLKK